MTLPDARRAVLCAAAAALIGPVCEAQPAVASTSPAVVAFEDVTVVPMDGERVLPNQTVVVRDGRIANVGAARDANVPAGALRVDGRGKFLLPGLAEMHAHVPPGTATEEALRDIMFLYVANGVTTIRGMLGAPYQLALRDRLAKGEILGPTLYVGAPSLNGNSAPTADTAAKLVRAHKAAGYDLLKIHPGLTRPAYDAMVATAREVGMTFAGHVPQEVGVRRALASRQSTIDHLDGYLEGAMSDSAIARLRGGGTNFADFVRSIDAGLFASLAQETKARGTWNVPTMFLWESFFGPESPEAMAQRPEMRYVSRQAVEGWQNQKRNRIRLDSANAATPELAARYLALRRRMLKALADAGALLLMGTDSPQMFNVPGFALHRELQVMSQAGLTPYQVLESGTRNVARYAAEDLKLDGAFGTVAVGNRADLVLLEANPLEGVENVAKRAGVMVRGRWVPASEIEAGLAALVARMER
ncbi:MAG: amidohydrolase family protein [Gemmatimonadota bacterium]|nr:amidohydrolase family protein [Gemmatimonadota bacterium]